MSGGPRIRSINVADPEHRPVLGPAGNKGRSVELQKRVTKPQKKLEKAPVTQAKEKKASLSPVDAPPAKSTLVSSPSTLKQQDPPLRSYVPLNASCSSDGSSDSSYSRVSTERIARRCTTPRRRKQCAVKTEKAEKVVDGLVSASSPDNLHDKKTCTWITANTDPCYIAFHDEEWGVPVHEDKKLFELLVLSGALGELTWPAILNRRHIFREVFFDFDPVAVSKLNEKKLATAASAGTSLLSEVMLRAIIENARLISKIRDEFGSFDKYIWSFVNGKPIVGRFRYPRQVPSKSPKGDIISKDLIRRGFRSVGPTVIYSFMQAVGLTNDHLITCFRFQDCVSAAEVAELGGKDDGIKVIAQDNQAEDTSKLGMAKSLNGLRLSFE